MAGITKRTLCLGSERWEVATPRASFIPAKGNALESSVRYPRSAEGAIHLQTKLANRMNQAFSLPMNHEGAMNPAHCAGLV